MENSAYDRQQRLDKAMALEGEGRTNEAIAVYESIIAQSPGWSVPYYNLGLIYKYSCQWQQSYDCNKKAAELAPDDEAAWWNLGIAATALLDWKTARQAWNHFGLNLEETEEELNMDLGRTPIRVSVEDEPEVVWATRICPARAVIESVPFGESGRRYQDIVLNDGAPAGYRVVDGHEYPVFNELQLIQASAYKTYTVTVDTFDQELVDHLAELCGWLGIGFEDWTTVRILCKQCSEGTPHEHHDHDLAHEAGGNRIIGLAATGQQQVEELLKKWKERTGVGYSTILLGLE